MSWISVNDRLPDPKQDVWAWCRDAFGSKARFIMVDPYGPMFKISGEHFPSYNSVSHWMPLPAPPGSEPDNDGPTSGLPCDFDVNNPDKVIPL